MSKQTSVDWLIEQLTPSISLQQKHIDELFKQAKEIEKQQIIKFTNNYLDDDADETVEQFYNKTFNK
jgi:hypothetical protein